MPKNFAVDPRLSRRRFLQGGAAAAAGLTIGFHWNAGVPKFVSAATAADGTLAPNAFVRIAANNTVTVLSKHLEMGQGVHTGLATIVAEELDADWGQIRVAGAPADASLYNNLRFGSVQGTGASSSIANSYDQLRKAGATARALLIEAAAKEWGVDRASITVEKGVVSHAASGRTATFGELAPKAVGLPVPSDVPLKDPSRFTLIGTSVPRVDTTAKTTGTAQFALDVKLPGMLTAVIARSPVFGGTVKSVDATAAKAVPGVVKVVQVPSGVAVVATNFWAASNGREALIIRWDETAAETRGTTEILADYKALAEKPGTPAQNNGDVAKALAGAAKTITAAFEFPYLAHAPMEPLDCVVRLDDAKCEIWAGDQFQTIDQSNAAAAAGLKPEQVQIHTLVAGGSFGRRSNAVSDYIVEAVHIAKALDRETPVKLVWTREDDIRGGRYRPMYYHTLTAGLDAQGKPVAWQHRIVGQSIMSETLFAPFLIKDGIDGTSVDGADNLPYDIPNLAVDLHTTKIGVPVLWWRAVGSTHTAYSTEVFIDELAHAAGKDPVEFRRALLTHHPRHRAVLELAAEKAGWGTRLPDGKVRGVAVHESFGTYVAQVAEIAMQPDGSFKVDRVVCAVDCGRAINPDVIKAQMEGGIGFGLGAVLYGELTLDKGKVQQSNFHDYRVLRIDEMPNVEVHIVPSSEPPTGVGEPGVPPIGPAVANAVFAATGRRVRNLPFIRDHRSYGRPGRMAEFNPQEEPGS